MPLPRRALLLASAALVATLSLSACGTETAMQEPAAGISVVTSTNVYGSIVEEIGGAHVRVHAIISKAGADPHDYEATAQDKLAVSKAQVGVYNGGGYDDFFTQLAKGQLQETQIVEASGFHPAAGSADFNEHVWYSLPAMNALADDLATRFGALDPDNLGFFQEQAAKFKAQTGELEKRVAGLPGAGKSLPVAMTEPAPEYLLELAGLRNLTPADFTRAVENGSDASATILRDTVALMVPEKIALLAYNSQTASSQTQELRTAAEASGVPVADFAETLPPGENYLDWMATNVASLEAALTAAQR